MRYPSSIGKGIAVVLGLSLGGAAHAQQQTYNVDGTPALIRPDGTFADQPVDAPGNVPARAAEPFAEDCDPDVEACADANAQAYDDGYDPSAYQQFESALDPYGTWLDDPNYGRVWVPSPEEVGSDFEPYETGGQWVPSNDYGFTWVSDWDWGWGPFHYGRWACLNGSMWAWVPGTIWGPAWVNWRYGGGYVGWSPMAPRGVVVPPPHSMGHRSAWRFALATELFHRNPTLLPAHVAATVWSRTSAVHNARTIGFGAVNARINLGPSLATLSHDLGRQIPALGLRNSAPSVLPRAHVVARAGVAVAQRSYMHGGAPTLSAPVHAPSPAVASRPIPGPAPYRYGPTQAYRPTRPYPPAAAYPRPVYRPAPPAYAPPAYRPAPTAYAPPAYAPPAYSPYQAAPAYRGPSYAPAYHAPAQSYAPAYHAPAQSYAPAYHAPSYSPPATSYHAAAPAPAAHFSAPAPHFSAPAASFGGHRR
jgi:hypothetical protein